MNDENRISKSANAILYKIFTFLNFKSLISTKISSKKVKLMVIGDDRICGLPDAIRGDDRISGLPDAISGDDRISGLPDAILCKIFTFLDLKSTIRTSTLSKRWKPVWTFLEDFDFDFERYRRETETSHSWRPRKEALLPYVRIVNGVLSNRDDSSKIGKFRLAFRINVDPIFIQNCVHYAASHNVEELDLAAFHSPKPFNFPQNFLESRSLHKLRLKYHYGGNMIIPKPFCLPNLKILYLECFPFKDDDDLCFPKEPFSCFPNLEELTLDCCIVDGLMILAPELRFLELQFRGYRPQLSFDSKSLKVVTPKLKSFKFEGQVSLDCQMDELSCLDDVCVYLYPLLESPYLFEDEQNMPINLFKLLEQLKNARSLSLSFTAIQLEELNNKDTQMNDEDTISKLPDAILSKILSFLDLKSAIRTSTLSKRWKPLWTFLEDFDFDFNKYQRETDPLQAMYHWPHKEVVLRAYIRFVNGVLSNRDDTSKIGKFRLAFNRVNVDPVFIQSCVHYALSHNVEDLDLATYHYPKPFCFPPNFFESRSLRKLRLKYYFRDSLIIPKPFCLPSLKILYLEHFEFKDDDDFCFPKEPFSCFPNLEELTLACCLVDGLMILAPKLIVLELKFRGYQPRYSSESTILKVSTPRLESFKYVGQVSLICPTEELTCLDNVYVDIYPISEPPYTNVVKEKMPINLFKFLEQFKNANTLTLSFGTIQVLSMDSDVLRRYPSPFINLKHLKFVWKPWEKLRGLLSENVMAYLTDASSFSDSIIVENHDN